MKWALLFAGGGIGAVLRFALGSWIVARAAGGFPWSTFAVNVVGCLAIGFAVVAADDFGWLGSSARLFLVVGLLGGFTTFSTFGFETISLLIEGRFFAAVAYAGGSVVLGVAAVGVALGLGRTLE